VTASCVSASTTEASDRRGRVYHMMEAMPLFAQAITLGWIAVRPEDMQARMRNGVHIRMPFSPRCDVKRWPEA